MRVAYERLCWMYVLCVYAPAHVRHVCFVLARKVRIWSVPVGKECGIFMLAHTCGALMLAHT